MRQEKNIKNIFRVISVFVAAIFSLYLYACNKVNFSVNTQKGARLSIPFGRSSDYSDILVKKAVDGDTLVLETGERVRLIGIDTPEMHESDKLYRDSQRTKTDIATIQAMGRQAWEFTKKLVEGKHVSLEFDVQKHDKYKRLLAYVYLTDGTFLNAEIVRGGYASLMTIQPNVKYADLFLKLFQEARENQRGLWK